MTTPAKRKALLASGTLNPHPEAVRSALFHMDFFDPYDFAQVKYEMLRAHSVDEDPVAEVCRQFGLSRESFYQIQQAFQELGFSCFLSRKRGRKGPVKLKGELLEFALAQKKENPVIDPGHLAALIQERYGIAIHRTTVLRGDGSSHLGAEDCRDHSDRLEERSKFRRQLFKTSSLSASDRESVPSWGSSLAVAVGFLRRLVRGRVSTVQVRPPCCQNTRVSDSTLCPLG
jgi:transposase